MAHSPTIYTPLFPLADPQSQIRLLRIASGGSGDDIACTVSAWSLTNAPEYIAISYVWGVDGQTRSISIWRKGSFQGTMEVSYNCWYALRQAHNARLGTPEAAKLHYWIDAVCINQLDLDEKASQVQIMGDIFGQAALVIAALGAHADDSELLFQKVFPTVTESALESLRGVLAAIASCKKSLLDVDRRQWNLTCDTRAALMAFATRPYWSRVWILQEFLLTSHVVMLCGEHCLIPSSGRRFTAFDQDFVCTPMAQLLSVNISNLRDVLFQPETEIEGQLQLLQLSCERFCCEPRDHIYSLVRFTPPKRRESCPWGRPDYTSHMRN